MKKEVEEMEERLKKLREESEELDVEVSNLEYEIRENRVEAMKIVKKHPEYFPVERDKFKQKKLNF